MEPQFVLVANISNFRDRIEGAQHGGTRSGVHEEGDVSASPLFLHKSLQFCRNQPAAFV